VGGFRACHAKPILLFICNNICCFGLKIGLGAQLAMSDWQRPCILPSILEPPALLIPPDGTDYALNYCDVETRRSFCQERVVGRVRVS